MGGVKHCAYGTCNSDNRYADRPHMRGVTFFSFPNKRWHKEKLERWVRLCKRQSFTVNNVTPHTYICSLHFAGGKGPTPENPDPTANVYACASTMKVSRGDTIGCAGCYRKLQVGEVPPGLEFPSGSGLNIWSRVPDNGSSKTVSSIEGNPTSDSATKDEISLCRDCFNGHVNGKKNLPLSKLGISVAEASFTEATKYLKIEGPVKYVFLGEESLASKPEPDQLPLRPKICSVSKSASITQKELNFFPKPTRPAVTGHGTIEPKTDIVSVSKLNERTKNTIQIHPVRTNTVEVPPLLNFLAVGSGALGSVEMTDDDGSMPDGVVSILPDSSYQDEMVLDDDDSMDYIDLNGLVEPVVEIQTDNSDNGM